MQEENTLFSPEEIQIDDSGEVQLSTAIKKNLNPSDNCDEQGALLYNLDAIIAVGYRVNGYDSTESRGRHISPLGQMLVCHIES